MRSLLPIFCIFGVLFFAVQSSNAQMSEAVECESFRTGTYFYSPPNGGEVTFKRTKKKQIEHYNNENQRFIFSIEWTDECSYTLVLIKAKGVDKELRQNILGSELICEVIQAQLDNFTVLVKAGLTSQSEILKIYRK